MTPPAKSHLRRSSWVIQWPRRLLNGVSQFVEFDAGVDDQLIGLFAALLGRCAQCRNPGMEQY